MVFDVETASNDIGRMFFRHSGPHVRSICTGRKSGTMAHRRGAGVAADEFFRGGCISASGHNERFRRQLYENYLGGLDMEKFPLLFKRAIPFRMNIRLEDFVKEYICMEQNIRIE